MPKLSEHTRQALFAAATSSVVDVARSLGNIEKDKGVHWRLFLFDRQTKDPPTFRGLWMLYESWIGGSSNKLKQPVYEMFSFEKAIRLGQHVRHGHCSSSQSMDEEKDQYPGAFLVPCIVEEFGDAPVWILTSMSGLPWRGDEGAGALALTRMKHWRANQDGIRRVLKVTKNTSAQDLIDAELRAHAA